MGETGDWSWGGAGPLLGAGGRETRGGAGMSRGWGWEEGREPEEGDL